MILQSSTEIRRYTGRKSFGGRQDLVREYRVAGVKIWSTVLDTESVPSWAEIQLATLGYTSWTSKFSPFSQWKSA